MGHSLNNGGGQGWLDHEKRWIYIGFGFPYQISTNYYKDFF